MPKKITYADSIQPDFGIPYIPIPPKSELNKWDDEKLKKWFAGRKAAEAFGDENPVMGGWRLPMWEKVMANFTKYSIHCVLGGNQCLAGETPLTDPVAQITRSIREWAARGEPLHVLSSTTEGVRPVLVPSPFLKGRAPLWDMSLRGTRTTTIRCAAQHKFLTPSGWLPFSRVSVGTLVAGLRVPPESRHASVSDDDFFGARSGLRKAQDCSDYYYEYCRQCDELLLSGATGVQVSPTSPYGAPKYSHSLLRSDGLDLAPQYSHEYCENGRQPNCGDFRHNQGHSDCGSSVLFREAGPAGPAFLSTKPSPLSIDLVERRFLELGDLSQCTGDGEHHDPASVLVSSWESLAWFKVEHLSCHGVEDYFDLTVPIWTNYIASGIVHANSGKTTLGARMTTSVTAAIPECESYCWHISEKRSIDDQQRFIWESLPTQLKRLPTKKGISHSLQYTQKNGFTDGICILPPWPGYQRGGSIKFYNYAQYFQNDQIIEGIKSHFIWLDEKVPLKLFETLMYRLFTYHGRMLLTYTVIDGWNDTIEKILARTKTLEKRWCDHPKIKGYLPTVQESLSMDSTCIYYCWTDDNPFTDPKEFWKLNRKSDKPTILARAFGIPTKAEHGAFPMFVDDYAPIGNVMKHEDLPFIKNPGYKVTRFMACDPGGSKNYVFIWVAIDAAGTWYVYDEWPDYDEWAMSGNKAGPAQKGLGKGFKDYAELIASKEGELKIFERVIDPRASAAERQAEEGASTILTEFDNVGLTFTPAPGGSGTAGKTEIEDGIQMINDLLVYDQTKPIDHTNMPRLYISDRCTNMRFCMKDYTGKLGYDEASKDFCDLLRYLRKAKAMFIPEDDYKKAWPTGVY